MSKKIIAALDERREKFVSWQADRPPMGFVVKTLLKIKDQRVAEANKIGKPKPKPRRK